MTDPADLEVSHGYTRQAVEEYLQGVEVQRRELEEAIADARARASRAADIERRLTALEKKVGESIVAAHAQADARSETSNQGDQPADPGTGLEPDRG